MENLVTIFLIGIVVGLASIASNPSPYFAALGLVVVAGMGCGCLVGYGGSFLSLVLFLIYLGGILVVFAYSAALAAEPYPEGWGSWAILGTILGYLIVVLGGVALLYQGWHESTFGPLVKPGETSVKRVDIDGAAEIYSAGGGLLVAGAWALLLTLFGVLELARGASRGALRAL